MNTLQHAPATSYRSTFRMKSAARAYARVFGAEPVFSRRRLNTHCHVVQEALGVPILFMGFGFPDDNLHARTKNYTYRTSIVAFALVLR